MAKRPARTLIQRSRSKGSAEKAAYHQIVGAGKSRVKRPFFGISRSDELVIAERVSKHLDRLIQEGR